MHSLYHWLLFTHIFSFVAWMAGIFYLPRLFVYHCEFEISDKAYAVFCTMESRLLKIIMMPAMCATLLTGFFLASMTNAWGMGWFHVKMLAIIFMLAFHVFLMYSHICFKRNENKFQAKFFRIINEIPTILLGAVLFAVIIMRLSA